MPTIAQAANAGTSSINGCKADEVAIFRGGTAGLENDLFAGTDQNYTNGVAFTAASHDLAGKPRGEAKRNTGFTPRPGPDDVVLRFSGEPLLNTDL